MPAFPCFSGQTHPLLVFFPEKSAHIELRELVNAGLTPYQALAAGTRSAGAFIGSHVNTTPFGTITAGSRGDVLLLRHNPLEDVANAAALEGVLLGGSWLANADLQRMREVSLAATDPR